MGHQVNAFLMAAATASPSFFPAVARKYARQEKDEISITRVDLAHFQFLLNIRHIALELFVGINEVVHCLTCIDHS